MEEYQEEYDDRKMEELKERFTDYHEYSIEVLDNELKYLHEDLDKSERMDETEELDAEIAYVKELRRRKLSERQEVLTREKMEETHEPGDLTQGQPVETSETGNHTREQLEEKYPDLSKLSYDELMDRGDRLLNEMILSDLDEDSFKEKSEELRYIRMLSGDYLRESNINRLLNLRDKVRKRKLIKRDDTRKLELFKIWARENAGILSAVLISSASVIIGLVAATRNILWKVGDTTGKLDKRISELLNHQIELPPVFREIADGVELAADNIWIIIACAAVVLLYKYN